MDANEIIETLNEMREFQDRGIFKMDNLGKEYVPETLDDTYKETIDEIINQLDRSRIRITKDEPPTREDAEKDCDGYLCVLAYANKWNDWYSSEYRITANHSDQYPYWTCLPELPEVTP